MIEWDLQLLHSRLKLWGFVGISNLDLLQSFEVVYCIDHVLGKPLFRRIGPYDACVPVTNDEDLSISTDPLIKDVPRIDKIKGNQISKSFELSLERSSMRLEVFHLCSDA